MYQEATQYTVDAVKDIINVILKIGGSDKSCDDLFTVSIDYSDMLEAITSNAALITRILMKSTGV